MLWLDERKGLACGHWDIGTYQREIPSLKVEIDGLKLLANTLGIARAIENEESTVGTQTGCIVDHLLIGKTEIKHLVEQGDHKAAIAAATTHTSLCGYALIEMGVDARQSREVGLQQIVGTHHKIALLVAFDIDISNLQVAING